MARWVCCPLKSGLDFYSIDPETRRLGSKRHRLHSLPGGYTLKLFEDSSPPSSPECRGPFAGRFTLVIRLLQGVVFASSRAWEPPFEFVERVP